MTLQTSLILSSAMTVLQLIVQNQPALPEEYKHIALFSQIALEALKSVRAHYFNTDGTSQSVGPQPDTTTTKLKGPLDHGE